jgi:hypothetical protein
MAWSGREVRRVLLMTVSAGLGINHSVAEKIQ